MSEFDAVTVRLCRYGYVLVGKRGNGCFHNREMNLSGFEFRGIVNTIWRFLEVNKILINKGVQSYHKKVLRELLRKG